MSANFQITKQEYARRGLIDWLRRKPRVRIIREARLISYSLRPREEGKQ